MRVTKKIVCTGVERLQVIKRFGGFVTRDHTELTVKGDLGLYFDQNRPVLVFERDPNKTLF